MTEEEQLALAIQMSKTCKYFCCLGLNISLDIELVFSKSHYDLGNKIYEEKVSL